MSESTIKRQIRAPAVSSADLGFAWTILATLKVSHIADVQPGTSPDAPTRRWNTRLYMRLRSDWSGLRRAINESNQVSNIRPVDSFQPSYA